MKVGKALPAFTLTDTMGETGLHELEAAPFDLLNFRATDNRGSGRGRCGTACEALQRGMVFTSFVRTSIAALATIALVAGCQEPDRPNVILVTIDTLRADRLGSYGYEIDTSPFLDSLAARGIRFKRAYSTSSWTSPALVSLISSLDPTVHGIETAAIDREKELRQNVIPQRAVLLAELLRARGYRTYGVTANGLLASRFGFDRGFDRYECLGFETAEEVERVITKWSHQIVAADPYFLWIHLLDPHAPYDYHGLLRELYGPNPKRLWPYRLFSPLTTIHQTLEERQARLSQLNPLYDGEIRHVDGAIERMFTNLHITSADLVVVTADHGEEMLDHGQFGHGGTLYEEVIAVPLIVRLPGDRHAGTVVESPVRLIDVLPTILDTAQIDEPTGLQGRSLLPVVRGEETEPREILTSLARREQNKQRSLTRGDWKYLQNESDPSQNSLFDLSRDPGEQQNLLATEGERAQSMAKRLLELVAEEQSRRLESSQTKLSEVEVERLRALGYLPQDQQP